MCKVGWFDDGLRLLTGIGGQQCVLFAYHFGKVLLRFGVLTTQYDGKFEVAEHGLALIFAINHVKVGQRLGQHHNTDVAFPQFTQGLGNLQLAERGKFVKTE